MFLLGSLLCLVGTVCLYCHRGLWRAAICSFYSTLMTIMLVISIIQDYFSASPTTQEDPIAFPGEVVVVTGGARGLGLDIVKKFLHNGVCVILGCREVDEDLGTLDNLYKSGLTSGSYKCYQLDLTSRSSIQNFASLILQNHPQIHVLLNNSGQTNRYRTLTDDGVESTFCINYLGHFYLSHLLLERLVESARTRGRHTRIVNISSCVHYFPFIGNLHLDDLSLSEKYHEYLAYGQSKLAQLMFTKALDAKLRAVHLPVQVHAVHPGAVFTYFSSTNLFHTFLLWFFPFIRKTCEEGARSAYYACISPRLELRGGTYISGCKVVPTGLAADTEQTRNQLWTVSKNMLKLETFGGMLT